MKRNRKNHWHPLSVTADTLRHLVRSELAVVSGGHTSTGNTNEVGGSNSSHTTNADGDPTVSTVTQVAWR